MIFTFFACCTKLLQICAEKRRWKQDGKKPKKQGGIRLCGA
jgi:hypothetical protein